MTVTIEVAADVESVLTAKARRRGVSLSAYLRDVAQREAATPDVSNAADETQSTPEIAARLAALHEMFAVIDAQPNHRAGLPELDLSGERADVYGYTEREDAQL